MTRFQTQGPRIAYTPVKSEKPFQQVVGLYNVWQSLAPETRDWIASLFRSGGDAELEMPELDSRLDTSLTYQDIPEFGSEDVLRGSVENIVGGPLDWDAIASIENPIANAKPNQVREHSALKNIEPGARNQYAWENLL